MIVRSYSSPKNGKLIAVAAGAAGLIAVVALLLWYLDSRDGSARMLAQSSDPAERKQAVERLRGRKSSAARKTLALLSRDTDKWVAIKAVRTLGEDGSEDSRRTLEQIVRDRNLKAGARGEAAAALGRYKNADPKVLTQALIGDPNGQARAGAAKGLMRMRKPETLPELVQALEDPDAKVRIWAITAIHKMIARRFPYDARKPPQTQQREIQRIRDYLKSCGVLR
jgi:HEAT repeat protein